MESGDFISTVFTCRKEGGTFRFALNLKHLNDFIANKYLKMKSIQDIFKITKKDVWMATVGLKDSFFHKYSINEAYKKNFMFGWLCKLHKFYAMPNGYYDSC